MMFMWGKDAEELLARAKAQEVLIQELRDTVTKKQKAIDHLEDELSGKRNTSDILPLHFPAKERLRVAHGVPAVVWLAVNFVTGKVYEPAMQSEREAKSETWSRCNNVRLHRYVWAGELTK